jgi:threonine/homoserine/homoserine lactone efflux protein
MTADLFLALVGFAFVTSVTPGPNNLMLLASGVNFGFWRTLPHMAGVGLGFGFMILALGLGMAQVFETFPQVHGILRVVGGLYMLWLAWKIANSGPAGEGKARPAPMTFLGAAAFQWVNPKAWAMALGAIAAYAMPANYALSVVLISLIFVVINIPSIASWVLFGQGLRRFLADPRHNRLFNVTMAVLLVASILPLLYV